MENGQYAEITINENNSKKIKDYFITETETKPIIKELIFNKDIGYNEKEKFKDNMAVLIQLKNLSIISDLKTLNQNNKHKTEIKFLNL